MGPFYCPADRKAYIDLSFYDQMRTRYKAPGDFAQAYVIAHEIDEALNAASAIGDDTLQRQSQGTIVPESFTHGTSAQRQRWFREGLGSGDPDSCDTFSVDRI